MPAPADPPALAGTDTGTDVNPDPGTGTGTGTDVNPGPGTGTGTVSLAARQLALVSALVTGAAPPEGVDPERVSAQARALLRKRARSVARHQPDLAAALGDGFWTAFEQYAARSAPPAGSDADAKAFAGYVRKTRRRSLFRR